MGQFSILIWLVERRQRLGSTFIKINTSEKFQKKLSYNFLPSRFHHRNRHRRIFSTRVVVLIQRECNRFCDLNFWQKISAAFGLIDSRSCFGLDAFSVFHPHNEFADS